MSTFTELLHRRSEAIADRWFAEGVGAYAPEAATLLSGQRDRFANPVGHGLRTGTRAVLDALLRGDEDQPIRAALEEIVAMRAVQELAPSRALAFVFALKRAVRAELGEALLEPGLATELAELDARVDRVALLAFDAYVDRRERVSELRIQELKRNIPWAVTRASGVAVEGGPA